MAKSCAYKKAFELTCFRICKKRTIIVTSTRAERLRTIRTLKRNIVNSISSWRKKELEKLIENILIKTRKEGMKNAFG